jgi:hypothetical protein
MTNQTYLASRNGNKWTVNELLELQREFELLGLDIDQIAENHKRTANAIMFKLNDEGFADYNVLYSNYHNLNANMPTYKTSELDLMSNQESDEDLDEENYDYTDDDYEDNEDEDEDDDDDLIDEDDDPLTKRVVNLEAGLEEIRNMLKQMVINTKPLCGIDNCNLKSCNL